MARLAKLLVACLIPVIMVACGDDAEKKKDTANDNIARMRIIASTLSSKGIYISYQDSLPLNLSDAETSGVKALLQEFVKRGNKVLNLTNDGDVYMTNRAAFKQAVKNAYYYLAQIEQRQAIQKALLQGVKNQSAQKKIEEKQRSIIRLENEMEGLRTKIFNETGISIVESSKVPNANGLNNELIVKALSNDQLLNAQADAAHLYALANNHLALIKESNSAANNGDKTKVAQIAAKKTIEAADKSTKAIAENLTLIRGQLKKNGVTFLDDDLAVKN